jgi:hypothetical protein
MHEILGPQKLEAFCELPQKMLGGFERQMLVLSDIVVEIAPAAVLEDEIEVVCSCNVGKEPGFL